MSSFWVLSRAKDKRDFKRRVICPSVFPAKISKKKAGRGVQWKDGCTRLAQSGARSRDDPSIATWAATRCSTFDISARLMIRSAAARLSSSVQSDAIIRNAKRTPEKPVSRNPLMRASASPKYADGQSRSIPPCQIQVALNRRSTRDNKGSASAKICVQIHGFGLTRRKCELGLGGV